MMLIWCAVQAVGGFGVLVWGVTTWHDKRHVTLARARQAGRLRLRADYEHWCHIHGHPAGTYGQYRPHV